MQVLVEFGPTNASSDFFQHFSFFPLRPFFCAALAKRWKVQFRQGFAYFNNNVDSKRHIIMRTAILYIYIDT